MNLQILNLIKLKYCIYIYENYFKIRNYCYFINYFINCLLYYILPYKSLLGDGNPQLKVVKGKRQFKQNTVMPQYTEVPWMGTMDYNAPIDINNILVKSGWPCDNLHEKFITTDGNKDTTLCNAFHNSASGNRCEPAPGTQSWIHPVDTCTEGKTQGTEIKCKDLRNKHHSKCREVTDEEITAVGEFHDQKNWNQDLCQAFYESDPKYRGNIPNYKNTGSICTKNWNKGHPCIKSETKKCNNEDHDYNR